MPFSIALNHHIHIKVPIIYHSVFIASNLSISDIQIGYRVGATKLGFGIVSHVFKNRSFSISCEVWEKFLDRGYPEKKRKDYEVDRGIVEFGPEDFVNMYLFTVSVGAPNLIYSRVEMEVLEL